MSKFNVKFIGRNTTMTIFADNKRDAVKRVLEEIGPGVPMEVAEG